MIVERGDAAGRRVGLSREKTLFFASIFSTGPMIASACPHSPPAETSSSPCRRPLSHSPLTPRFPASRLPYFKARLKRLLSLRHFPLLALSHSSGLCVTSIVWSLVCGQIEAQSAVLLHYTVLLYLLRAPSLMKSLFAECSKRLLICQSNRFRDRFSEVTNTGRLRTLGSLWSRTRPPRPEFLTLMVKDSTSKSSG